jgi:hypothetical protein
MYDSIEDRLLAIGPALARMILCFGLGCIVSRRNSQHEDALPLRRLTQPDHKDDANT